MMDLINEQNVEWTSLVQRQSTEIHALRRQHTKEQCDLLRLLLDETQKSQMKEMTERQIRSVDRRWTAEHSIVSLQREERFGIESSPTEYRR